MSFNGCGVIFCVVLQTVNYTLRGIGFLLWRSYLRMDGSLFDDLEPLFIMMGLFDEFVLESDHLNTVLYIFFEIF